MDQKRIKNAENTQNQTTENSLLNSCEIRKSNTISNTDSTQKLNTQNTLTDYTQKEIFSRCESYLQKKDFAISGQGGHNKTFEAVCDIFRFGCDDDMAWEFTNWINDNKCDPKWKINEVIHKFEDAKDKISNNGEWCKLLFQKPPYRQPVSALLTSYAPPATPQPKPIILVPGSYFNSDGDYVEQTEHDFQDQTISFMPPNTVYTRGLTPVRLIGKPGSLEFLDLDQSAMRSILTKHIDFKVWGEAKGKDEKPNVLKFKKLGADLAKFTLDNLNSHPAVKPIKQFVNYPVFIRDAGRFKIAESGLNPDGTYYDQPPSLKNIEPERDPSVINDFLQDITVDFPFQDEASRENFFSLLLTPLLKPAIKDNTPLFMVMASLPRTGKTMLVEQVYGIIVSGESLPSQPLPKDEAEKDKRFGAMLMQGKELWHFDNLAGFLDSPSFASLLTSKTYEARKLGKSQMMAMPNNATIVATANNPRASEELVKRTVPIILEPNTDSPEMRDDFVHPDLYNYLLTHRKTLLECLIGMVLNWIDAGSPRSTNQLGGFNAWSGVVGGILAEQGYTKWRSNESDWREASDTETQEFRGFVEAWWEKSGRVEISIAEAVDIANKLGVFDYVLSKNSDHAKALAMGRFLSSKLGSPVLEYRIVKLKNTRKPMYRLELIDEKE